MKKNDSDFYRCSECKLEFIYPQPGNEALNEIYSKNYYDAWGLHVDSQAAEKSKRFTFEYRLGLVEDLLKPGDKVLDCGCATGFFLDLVRQKGFTPYGIEISDYAAQVAKQKFGNDNIYQGNIEEASFEERREDVFNAVFMTDYIEHVRSPRETLRSAYRFLKPGGVMVITTPDTSSFTKSILNKSWIHYKEEHLFYFSKENIRRLLAETNVRSISFKKAKKYFTAEYVFHQFNTYKHPFFTPMGKLLYRMTPAWLRKKIFSITIGEMVVVVRKSP